MSSILGDMTNGEFSRHLQLLGLRQADAAVLLRVTPRTIRRWEKGEQPVPDSLADLLQAWRRLHQAELPWAADFDSILAEDDKQLRLQQDHARWLDAIRERVAARGGPAMPWRVDLRRHTATLGPATLSFYALLNGSFSLANYHRRDGAPDTERDRQMIEDAVVCISAAVGEAFKKFGPRWSEIME
jgi:transcriptional regulator with XRE-family HTH domain